MIRDLRRILDGWEYEPGKISVRRIIGLDGRDKIQTRVDLGLLQFEINGRPDGQRPFGHESLLDYHEARLQEYIRIHGDDEGFQFTSEECQELRHEAHLYYQRYLSLFVLEEYDLVERDTRRNLRVTDLCSRYGPTDLDRAALEAQRAYVVMMNVRARAYSAVLACRYEAALALVDQGLAEVRKLCAREDGEAPVEQRQEVRVLLALRDEILQTMPETAPSRLRWELEMALAVEDYERAAELRNRLAVLLPSQDAS